MAHAIRPFPSSLGPFGPFAAPAARSRGLAALAPAPAPVNLEALLDLLPLGVVVVDAELRLRRANAPARAVLERRDALRIAGGRLAATSAESHACLTRLVAAARDARGDALQAVVPCTGGERRVAISAQLLEASAEDARALVCLVLVEEHVPCPASMRGLSRRRRQVLEQLMAGSRPEAIACVLGLSEHTVRAYVKDLHRHFGAHSRGELLSRFISLPS